MTEPACRIESKSPDLTICPVCQAPAKTLFLARDFNRGVGTDEFRYARCESCGVLFLENPPTDLAAYYSEEYHQKPRRRDLERAALRESYQGEFIRRNVVPGRLVEIGAAWGTFALIATRLGFDVTAIEINEDCCTYLEKEIGVRAIRSNQPHTVLGSLPPSRAIVLWQTLEHLPEPHALLAAAAANLESGGILVVSTPNPTAIGFRLMGARWPHVDAPRHLWLFPIEHLTRHAQLLGLEQVEVTTSDLGARRWNRFAWQRFLANPTSNRLLRVGAHILGAAVSAALSPFEIRGHQGSSYTAVYRKGHG